MNLLNASRQELEDLQTGLESRYDEIRQAKLSLDLTRGKPASEQLDLSNDLDGVLQGFYLLQDGTDVRNYGGLLGIPEARELFAGVLGVKPAEIMVAGNSSLTLMYDYVAHMMRTCWREEALEAGDKIRFLCPVPGYDRHFTICETFDIEMINVPMLDTGPDMDRIEALLERDPLIKGIWCVPKYSNPTGCTYSDETVKRMAAAPKLAGENFRIMWDNAYAVHHLSDEGDKLLNIMEECRREETTDNIVILGSTSKVTFAGAGVAFLGTSSTNLTAFEKFLSASLIGFDKVNQLRHVRFLKDMDNLEAHMNRHKEIIKPKFDVVESMLSDALDESGIARWTRPNGGYFISLDTLPGLASEVVKLASDAGVKLTPAGATFPYGVDPEDRNIRIAPTYPSLTELKKALDALIICVQLASVRKLLAE
ncbi:MAG: aminotransferase class I/II-fold pyridoxal phosphate-dependent enzyme [Pseudomonadales bacterium]|nr:aminotransferase class I/II-fold pyridoxal phosphate-dependent enzyme [Pseudomonadales bacterium]